MDRKVEKLLYSKQDAAEALSLSVRSIDYLIAAQRLPMRRVGGKVMIPASALRSFAKHDHPGLVRGDGHVASAYSEKRQSAEAALQRFGPASEMSEGLPLQRVSGDA